MTVTRFQDLPLADRGREWDRDAAEQRVRRWAGAEDAPNGRYRRAFLWYDGDKPDEFTAYKLPIADVIGGELKAVPHAVMAAAQVLEGARSGVKLPAADVDRVKRSVERYYEKMGEEAPFEKAA
jgi:hypothetical protein